MSQINTLKKLEQARQVTDFPRPWAEQDQELQFRIIGTMLTRVDIPKAKATSRIT